MSGNGAHFTPDPSWPSILELAIKLWGEVTDRPSPHDIRFGKKQSKGIDPIAHTWFDYEAHEGGGYLEFHIKAMGVPPPKPNGHDKHDGPWNHIDKVYPYLAADGALILQVVRTLPTWGQRFSQRRPDPASKSGWRWSIRDIPRETRPLYRLPELLASASTGVTVWITEGEKDCDNVRALGLIATCPIGGAGKWWPHYVEAFRDRHVVILPDNDPQSRGPHDEPLWHQDGRPVLPGQDHAETVARSLTGVAASVRVLMLPNLPLKGDVSDWLAAGGNRYHLERLAREVPDYVPPAAPPPVDDDGDGGGPPEPPEPPDDKGDEPPEEWNDIPAPLMEAGALVTEQEAMRLFINIHHEQLRFNHSSGGWLIWQDHFWRPDERKLAFSWALELCRELAKQVKAKDPQKARLVIEKVRFSGAVETGARAMPQVATTQTDWDANPMLLGTPGGVVDLATGILRPGTHADMISRTTSVTPSLMPECPTWLAFLDFAMHGDEQLVRFIQRYFGYALTGVVIEEVFLFMFGPGGAGKGTMVETVASLLGDYASTVPMEVFTGQSWSPTEYYRANMAGQRLVVANEPERGARWAEAFIKETTGGDMLSGRHPMGRPFRFKPSHKMAMQGNHMPTLKGKSTGMERRLRILPVTRKPVTPDPHLKAKLMTEGPGILRWLIEGCLAWQKIGLNPPDAVLAAGSKYFEAQDVFTRWIEDRCILDRYAEQTPSDLRKSFNAWAKANGEDEMNGNAFAEALDQFESDPPIERGKYGKKGRFVKGIRIMPTDTTQSWNNP